jgi:hypothetical protein
MRLPTLRLPRLKLRGTTVQIAAGGLVMVAGAWLIGLWVVGIVLMVTGFGLGVDALLRNDDTAHDLRTAAHEDIMERYRRVK